MPFLAFYHSYINFFRGTPLYVQILNVHFGVIPPIYGKTNALITAFVALSLNSAAISLGMSKWQAMRFVILPQAIKRMFSDFGNEFIVLVKDSSLLALVTAPEIMYWSNTMKGQYLRIWEPYLTAVLIYFILTYSLSKLLNHVERRL
jgi:polar amino acid transport system permease protein